MNKKQVIDYFGSASKVAEALGITRQAVDYWDDNKPIPIGRAYQIEVKTDGALRVDPRDYEKGSGDA